MALVTARLEISFLSSDVEKGELVCIVEIVEWGKRQSD